MPNVKVKWGKQLFKDVECDPSESLEVFQAQLFCLTNVPVERQKLLLKGKKVKSNADLAKVKEGTKFMLMGSADELKPEPKAQTVFIEDMSDAQMAALVPGAPSAGLQNLGNTCYMASTLQALRSVPELKTSLDEYNKAAPGNPADPDHKVTSSLGALLKDMDSTTKPVIPMQFWSSFCRAYPQFAQQGPQGGYMQQDADECLSQIFVTLSQKLTQVPKSDSSHLYSISADPNEEKVQCKNMVDQLFGVELEAELKNAESDAEPPQKMTDRTYKLRCHIDNETNYMYQGIQSSLEEVMEKRSDVLGRNAQYKKQSRISRLPPYMAVQFVRFFWRNDTQKKAKILRRVKYPMKFDAMPLCSDKLRKSLTKARHIQVKEQDERLGLKSFVKDEPKKEEGSADAMEDDKEEEENKNVLPQNVSTGNYKLIAVITHKGRVADAGHYVGWVRVGDTDDWIKFDDDKVSKITSDEALALCGGGDWHCSYLQIYRRIDDLTPEGKQKILDDEKAAQDAKKFRKAGV